MKGEGKGLLAIWADIDKGYRLEFERWHNCEHIPERVGIPGFHVGHRYKGMKEAPMYFMFYETSGPQVLKSKAYLHALNNPSPLTRQALTHFRNTVRTIYQRVATSGKKSLVDAPYLYLVRFGVRSGCEKDFLQWYENECLQRICAIAGVCRGRVYKADEKISKIPTKERKIHGAVAAQQNFMALYEIGDLDLPASKPWKKVHRGRPLNRRMFGRLENVIQELYWHDFTMYAPAQKGSRGAGSGLLG